MKTTLISGLCVLSFLTGLNLAFAQPFSIDSLVLGGGGGTSTGGRFSLNGTPGQAEATPEPINGGNFSLTGGFWSRVAANLIPDEDLIVNGSFEDTQGTFVPDGNGVMSLPADSTVIPGWTVTNAELLWGTSANVFGPRTPYGALFLDFTGYHDREPYAGITQTLATTPGEHYRLSFALGSDEDVAAYRGPMSVSVTAGSASNSFTFVPVGPGNQWGSFAMDFTAASASAPLTFVGTATAGGAYLGLDNVSVVAREASLNIGAVEVSGNDFRFKFTTVPGRIYSIESRDNLESGAWQTVPGTERPGTGGDLQITIADLFSKSRQFYRVKVTQ